MVGNPIFPIFKYTPNSDSGNSLFWDTPKSYCWWLYSYMMHIHVYIKSMSYSYSVLKINYMYILYRNIYHWTIFNLYCWRVTSAFSPSPLRPLQARRAVCRCASSPEDGPAVGPVPHGTETVGWWTHVPMLPIIVLVPYPWYYYDNSYQFWVTWYYCWELKLLVVYHNSSTQMYPCNLVR